MRAQLKLMLTKGVESASTGIVHNFNAVTSDRCPSMVALDLKEGLSDDLRAWAAATETSGGR